MSKVRVCFLGTSEFARTCLQKMYEDPHYSIVGVVTQPDRPQGRKLRLTPSPVKSWAQSVGLKVIAPDSIKKDLILQEIDRWGAEVAVVVAYGQIVTDDFFKIFTFGAVNVHASLLPKWRGAAPIQRAIEAGDTETGVTLQKMVRELDAGDVLGVRSCSIPEHWNSQDLHDHLAVLGSELLSVELMDYLRGNLASRSQSEIASSLGISVSYAKKIEKSECEIPWSEPAKKIHDRVRAFAWGPGTWTLFEKKKLKIHRTSWAGFVEHPGSPPGTIVALSEEAITIACGQGTLHVLELQPESRSRMNVAQFIQGHELHIGDRWGKQEERGEAE